MKNHPSHHARFAPEITAGAIAGRMTCLVYCHPVKPKLFEDSVTFAGIPRMAPSTPKNIAHAIEVNSRIMTDSSIPKGPRAKRKPITIGKYPSIGMDCKRSMKGVRTSDATLFVAASIPKETPHTTEIARVIRILEIVANVYRGRFFISGYETKVTISQVMTQRATSPTMKLAKYLRKHNQPA